MDICWTSPRLFGHWRNWLFKRHWFSDTHGFTLCGVTVQWDTSRE